MATIQKRGGSYLIRCFDVESGKQKSMTWKPDLHMTKRQAKKALNIVSVEFEKRVQTGSYIDGSITFSKFAECWLSDYAEIQLQPNTLAGYKVMLPQINAAIGHIKLAKLQPHHIIEFLKNLSEKGIRRDGKYSAKSMVKKVMKSNKLTQVQLSKLSGLSKALINRCVTGKNVSYRTASSVCKALDLKMDKAFSYHGKEKLSSNTQLHYFHLIQSILSTAMGWQVILSNPCDRVKPPKKDTPPQAVLSLEEAQRLIKCLGSESILHRTAVLLLLYSGARRSEIYGLKWNNINLDKMQIFIEHAWKRGKDGKFDYCPCKNESSERVIALPDCCRTILTELRAHQNAQRLKCGDHWIKSNAVMLNEDGTHASPDELTSWFRKFCRKNGFSEKVHIHTLRHTSATLQIESHQSIRAVSARLGHSQTSTTMNIYSHAIQSADAKAAEVLGSLLPIGQKKMESK
ncbi:MAG TPA: site-specific integrase [Ruminococcaceae bacterium]|nr:site-specific integrase [Oscillospiraceae bacterium]